MNYMLGFCPEGPNCLNAHVKCLINPQDLSLSVLGNHPLEEDWIDKFNHYSKHSVPNYTRQFDQQLIICHRCGEEGHKSTFCQEEKISEEELNAKLSSNPLYLQAIENKTCFLCKQKGHYAEYCPTK
jgi:hypothetical protein